MKWIHGMRARVGLLARRSAERRMQEEMLFHLEMETEKYIREGMSPQEARRRAALAFGGVEGHKEEMRAARTLSWASGLSLDLRLGMRMLAKHPGMTLVGAVGMAVGIAISAALFTAIGTITNPSVPLDQGDRIVAIDNLDAATGTNREETHLHDLAAWRQELTAAGEMAAFRTVPRNVIGPDGTAEPLRVAEMTASGFRIARVPPLRGRYLVDEDEVEGAPAVVVIGHEVWQNRFAGSEDVIGRTLQLGGEPHTIVGVMPEGFGFPVNNRVWTPLRLDPSDYHIGAAPPINVMARLAPRASLAMARAQLATIGRRMAPDRPDGLEQIRPTVLPYGRAFMDDPQLAWAFELVRYFVGLLLAVIAVNVAILVYARTATRAGEIALRLALGASRARVVAQLFAEAFVLSALAAAIGLLIARFILRQVAVFFEQSGGELLPFWWDVRVTPATVLYSAGLAVIAAGIIGVLPALKLTGHRAQATLREMSGATGLRMGRGWTALIALQIVVSLSLIPLAAAVPLRELFASRTAAPPVPLDEIFTAEIELDRDTPPSAAAAEYDRRLEARFQDRRAELIRRLEAASGVAGVALASMPPGATTFRPLVLASGPARGTPDVVAKSLEVEAEVFELFGATLLAGRAFQPADRTAETRAVVVNRSFVQAFLGGGQVLGSRFHYGPAGGGMSADIEGTGDGYEIVGVVSDFPATGAGPRDAAAIYHPIAGPRSDAATLLVRVQAVRPDAFARRLREITTAVDPGLRLGEVLTIAEYTRRADSPERMLTLAIASLPWTVLLLSAAGIHALVSLTVSQRRREIGLRIALGARPGQVLRTIAGRALRQVALGLGLGGLVAGALIPVVTPSSGRAIALVGGIAGILLAVGVVAVWVPARRGLRIQPMEALRQD